MARPSRFDSLPPEIRDAIALKIRRDGITRAALVEWLDSVGYPATDAQVKGWIAHIKNAAAAANTAAEARAADQKVARQTGEEIPELDPLEYIKKIFMLAMQEGAGEVPRGIIESIKGATMLESAFIARQKLAMDRRSAQPEGNPVGKQITNEGIKWVRENVYGIFDADPLDDADRDIAD
jgi:hypothetical protein